MTDAQAPVPALVVSGFLGSGKTTLVRHLLDQARAEGVRLAIVSNEFGDLGIDKALLDAGSSGIVELDGGCVCCRLSDALGDTLEMLLTTVKPDRLVIETSGVALPGEILIQFWRPPLDALVSDEIVVVLVDGESYLRDQPQDETFLAQIESADLVVLNKCDLLEEESITAAIARLRTIVGDKPIVTATNAAVASNVLFPPDPEGARQARRDPAAEHTPHDHEEFVTKELAFPDGVDDGQVRWVIYLEGALRAKGFVRGTEGIRLVQSVGPRIEVGPSPVEPPEERIGRVVVIKRKK